MVNKPYGCKKCEGHDFTISLTQITTVQEILTNTLNDIVRLKMQEEAPTTFENIKSVLHKLYKMRTYHESKNYEKNNSNLR